MANPDAKFLTGLPPVQRTVWWLIAIASLVIGACGIFWGIGDYVEGDTVFDSVMTAVFMFVPFSVSAVSIFQMLRQSRARSFDPMSIEP